MRNYYLNEQQTQISIIMPVYNSAKYLRKAIDSVCRQTFKLWELILVDDGSTDDSGKICDEYLEKGGEKLKLYILKIEVLVQREIEGLQKRKGYGFRS